MMPHYTVSLTGLQALIAIGLTLVVGIAVEATAAFGSAAIFTAFIWRVNSSTQR